MKAYKEKQANKSLIMERVWKHFAAQTLDRYRVTSCLASQGIDDSALVSSDKFAMSHMPSIGLLPRYMALVNSIYQLAQEHAYGGTAFLWLTNLLGSLEVGTDMNRLYNATIIALYEDHKYGILRGISHPPVRAHIEIALLAHQVAGDFMTAELMDRLADEYEHHANGHYDTRCSMALEMTALLFSDDPCDQERFMQLWVELSALIELLAYPQTEEGRQVLPTLVTANMANRAAKLLRTVLDDQTTPF